MRAPSVSALWNCTHTRYLYPLQGAIQDNRRKAFPDYVKEEFPPQHRYSITVSPRIATRVFCARKLAVEPLVKGTPMKELIEQIAKAIVEKPEEVQVRGIEGEN